MNKTLTINEDKNCCGPTCCGGANTPQASLTQVVREKYGAVAESSLSSRDAGVHAVAEAFGYSSAELGSIPADANMGLSCGNPTAFASLKEGEVVVDLGCGGGLDVLLAAKQVGEAGKAIGIDMTPQMIERAKKNAIGIANVEFHLSTIEKLPLPDASVDCIISNCVINLSEDKEAVFREAMRVLKPGGRFAVSDIALKKRLPADLAADVAGYVGCVSGAIPIEHYRKGLLAAGFSAVDIVDSHADLNAYAKVEGQAGCCSPAMEASSPQAHAEAPSKLPASSDNSTVHSGLGSVLERYDINEYAASVKIFAIKG